MDTSVLKSSPRQHDDIHDGQHHSLSISEIHAHKMSIFVRRMANQCINPVGLINGLRIKPWHFSGSLELVKMCDDPQL